MSKRLIGLHTNPVQELQHLEKIADEDINKKDRARRDFLRKQKDVSDRFDESRNKNFGSMYYSKEGTPLSSWEWLNYINDIDYKTIQRDTFGPFFVSTVWMGVDHGFDSLRDPDYTPKIFDTMIFHRTEEDIEHKTDDLHGYMERYCTEEQAIEGHAKACTLALHAANKIHLEILNRGKNRNHSKQRVPKFKKIDFPKEVPVMFPETTKALKEMEERPVPTVKFKRHSESKGKNEKDEDGRFRKL